MPDEFYEIYICDALDKTYTELHVQPDWWVERMLIWKRQRVLAEDHNRKVQERAAKR